MTADEFQKKYHEYSAKTEVEAMAEAVRIGAVDGRLVEVVEFPGLGWALMLHTAAEAIKDMGIV